MRRLYFLTVTSLLAVAMLSSCEHKVRVESVVHADGSIDRSVVFFKADSGQMKSNLFGASTSKGWDLDVSRDSSSNDSLKDMVLRFHKHFPSATAANAETNIDTDTLFRIRSEFEKKFRWFYTSLRYSDTYVSLNHFRRVPQDDYFNREDYAFIERLPGEDTRLSKADSLYLSNLNSKIFNQYGTRVIFEEYFQVLTQLLEKNKLDKTWIDKLNGQKEPIYRRILSKDNDKLEDEFLVDYLIDSLHFPLNMKEAKIDYRALSEATEKRTSFVSDANEGRYTHVITMPWEVVSSNADSTHGNDLFWKPLAVKFVLRDYTMYAESRQMNAWALIVSGLAVAVVIFLFYKRRGAK